MINFKIFFAFFGFRIILFFNLEYYSNGNNSNCYLQTTIENWRLFISTNCKRAAPLQIIVIRQTIVIVQLLLAQRTETPQYATFCILIVMKGTKMSKKKKKKQCLISKFSCDPQAHKTGAKVAIIVNPSLMYCTTQCS